MTLSYPDIRKGYCKMVTGNQSRIFCRFGRDCRVATAGIAHGLLLAEADSSAVHLCAL